MVHMCRYLEVTIKAVWVSEIESKATWYCEICLVLCPLRYAIPCRYAVSNRLDRLECAVDYLQYEVRYTVIGHMATPRLPNA